MPLPQLDLSSCRANVYAQVRWMFGTSDLEGADAVREVDRLTGREPGTVADGLSQMLWLAGEGYRFIDFGPRADVTRLLADGSAYLREFWEVGRWPTFDRWWTPVRVADFAAHIADWRDRLAHALPSVRERIVEVERRPQVADVEAMLGDGYVVEMGIDVGHPGEMHAVLVYGRSGDDFLVYEPEMRGGGLTDWPSHWLAVELPLFATGITFDPEVGGRRLTPCSSLAAQTA